MTYWAHVSSGIVVNVSVGESPVDPDWLNWAQGTYDAVVDVTGVEPCPGIGWTYADGTFTPPPEPTPPEP